MNFRDAIASLPAQRLLPGHGVADLAFFVRFLVVQPSNERALLASTFDVANERLRIGTTVRRAGLIPDRAFASTSRVTSAASIASLIR